MRADRLRKAMDTVGFNPIVTNAVSFILNQFIAVPTSAQIKFSAEFYLDGCGLT